MNSVIENQTELIFVNRKGSEVIPAIINPLGRYWDQPDRDNISLTETLAFMDQKTFQKLNNYSCTRPTGIYSGKMWRSNDVLLWVEDDPNDETMVLIKNRKIVII